MRRWAPIALTVLALAAASCGTGSTPATTPDGPAPGAAATAAATTGAASTGAAGPASDYAAADALYRQMRPGLNLPPGVTFPEHLPQAGDRYQPNAGLVTAQNYWLCAWLWSYLDSAPAAKSQAQAAAVELVKYDRMDAYTKALDNGGRQSVDNAIRAAQSGSRQTVQSFAQTSCSGPFFGQSHPGTH
jgi:hypothetical protein